MKRLGIVGHRDAAHAPLRLGPSVPPQGGREPRLDSLPADRRVDLARRMAIFAAMVEHMDGAIGRVVASLKEHGQLDNTLILFLSDNGACAEWDPLGFDVDTGPKTTNVLHTGKDLAAMGGPGTYHSYGSGWANASNTPWRLYKHYAHEGGISTPLIAHWPAGLKRRGEMDSRVGHIVDIMATCVDVSGAHYPAAAAGPRGPADGRPEPPAGLPRRARRASHPVLGARGPSRRPRRPLEAGRPEGPALGTVRHRGRPRNCTTSRPKNPTGSPSLRRLGRLVCPLFRQPRARPLNAQGRRHESH